MRSKDEIIKDIKNSFDGNDMRLLGELLAYIRHENRERNDVEKGDFVILNQGEIRCCNFIAKELGIKLDENR